MTSIFTQRNVKSSIALTGEITLRGLVLPVGGIKEKVLAAKRAGLKHVLLPGKNKKDVTEIEQEVIDGIEVSYLERMDEVFDLMLERRANEDTAVKFKSRKTTGERIDNDTIAVH